MITVVLLVSIAFLAAVAYYIFYLAPKLDPNHRAMEYLKINKTEEAILEYKKILDNKPYDYATHYKLAELFSDIDEVDQAALHYEKVIEIGKFNYEIDKIDIEKKLAKIASVRDDIEQEFRYYYDILRVYPSDPDALYYAAFIALGQEEFDIAQRYFDKLIKGNEKDYSIMFGAGICSYQNQKFTDAVECFKYAVAIQPDSDIVNLAMAMALIKKRDFKSAVVYTQKLVSITDDPAVKFIGMRAHAFIDLYMKKTMDGVKRFEELLEFLKRNDMNEEQLLILYDIGFACFKAEMANRAYDYWNELSSLKRGYNNVQELVMSLRREMDMDESGDKLSSQTTSISDMVEDWLLNPFPTNFLWDICNLKEERKFNLREISVSTRVTHEGESEFTEMGYTKDLIDKFSSLDTENFRIIANRVVNKIGYKVEQILTTYRESDGIDFIAYKKDTREKTFVGVRRWKKIKVGEIPLRNFAQTVNDHKAQLGLFITTAALTEEAQRTSTNLSKLKIIVPEDLNTYLQGLL